MIKKIKKKFIILFFVIVILILLETVGILQNISAIFSSTIYVFLKYNDKGFTFQTVEYSPQFGDYYVTYKDKDNKVYSFFMTPKFFPIFVLYDPLDPGG